MISIVVPVFNEEERLGACLRSILTQDIVLGSPFSVEVIVVDSGSTDGTPRVTEQFRGQVRYCQALRGKLSARALGICEAIGDIIVAADGDSIYPAGWLRHLTSHFARPDVVAVSGPRLYYDAMHLNPILWLHYYVLPPAHFMSGGNSAFTKQAYFQVGGFRNVNQFDSRTIQREEEFAFGDRLARIGHYIYDRQAVCYTSGRRWQDARHMAERRMGQRF